MGNSRTSFAWLIGSLVLGLVSGLPHVTLADDTGPGKEVRAIRHDLPIIVSAELYNTRPPTKVHLDGVAVAGSKALVEWHSDDDFSGIDYLEKIFGRWWLRNIFPMNSSMAFSDSYCGPPDIGFFTNAGIGKDVATAAARALPAVIAAEKLPTDHTHPLCPYITRIYNFSVTFASGRQTPTGSGGYQLAMNVSRNDGLPDARINNVRMRPPTEAESWMARDGNSYFFFSGTLQSPTPVHVDAGTTIDVWFPFVLDTSQHYAITIGFTEKPIGPIDGTLKDNVVHFVLPAFTLLPGKTIMGEVEATPYAHS